MPRSPVTDSARSTKLTIRITETERDQIDTLRGSVSASDYLRGLVRADARRKRSAVPEG